MVKHDRRLFPRRAVTLTLEGRTRADALKTTPPPPLRLEVEDLSLGGLAARVAEPLAGGSRLAVYFPPNHTCRGALAAGKVVRCEPHQGGYRLCLEFDKFPSARGRFPYTAPELARKCA